MQINNLYSIRWGDSEKKYVILVADTDEGSNLTICTPYGTDSILWEQIKDIPQDQIGDYQPPVPVLVDVPAIQRQIDMLQMQLDQLKNQQNQ